MRLAISLGSFERRNIVSQADFVQHAERRRVDGVWSAKRWGQDAVTPLTYLAAKTERIKLAAGMMQISARVVAMTAALQGQVSWN